MEIYFAYGSCMSEEDLLRTEPEARFLGTAKVPNYKLAFTKYSHGRRGGVADIIRKKGEYVEGILWEVPNFDNLDAREGHPYVYIRRKIKVYPDWQTEPIWAKTYEVVQKEKDELQPSSQYAELLLDGSVHLSPEYQTKLEETLLEPRKKYAPKQTHKQTGKYDSHQDKYDWWKNYKKWLDDIK